MYIRVVVNSISPHCPTCGQMIMEGSVIPMFASVDCACGDRFHIVPAQTEGRTNFTYAPFDFEVLDAWRDPERPWTPKRPSMTILIGAFSSLVLFLGIFWGATSFSKMGSVDTVVAADASFGGVQPELQVGQVLMSFLLASPRERQLLAAGELNASALKWQLPEGKFGSQHHMQIVPASGEDTFLAQLQIGNEFLASATVVPTENGYKVEGSSFEVRLRQSLKNWLEMPTHQMVAIVEIERCTSFHDAMLPRDYWAVTLRDESTLEPVTAYVAKRTSAARDLEALISALPNSSFDDSLNDVPTNGAFTTTSRGHTTGIFLNLNRVSSAETDRTPVLAAVTMRSDPATNTIHIQSLRPAPTQSKHEHPPQTS